jgi:hypothetical protein
MKIRKESNGDTIYQCSGTHNHPQPSIRPLLPSVREKARELVRHEPPKRAHKQIIEDNRLRGFESTPTNTPSPVMLKNMRAYLIRSQFPTRDHIQNIIAKHGCNGTNFLREIHMYPEFRVILISNRGKELLETWGNTILVDTTFNLFTDRYEENLVLTVCMERIYILIDAYTRSCKGDNG